MTIHIDLVGDDQVQVVAGDIAEFIGHFSEHLSREGVFLETDLVPVRGRELQLTMRLEEGLVLVRGSAMVAWRRQQRAESSIRSAIALHLLEIEEGSEFLERLVREHVSSGGVAFSVDQGAPLTDDGSPPPADALDRMMAQRGDRKAIAELEDTVGEVQDHGVGSDENAPDFAPGFGKSDLWDSEVALEIPGQVNDWLEERPEAATRAVGEPSPAKKNAVPPPPPPTSPPVAARVPEPPGVQLPEAAPAPSQDSAPEPTGVREAASQVPKEAQTPRSGPIKMKLAADRQPDSSPSFEAHTRTPEPTPSRSFVEASRRVTELMKEGAMTPMTPSSSGSVTGVAAGDGLPQGEDPTLATVAIKPGDLAKMLERQAAAQGKSEGMAAPAKTPRPMTESAELELSRVGRQLAEQAARASGSVSAPAPADQTGVTTQPDAGEPSSSYKSELVIDPEVMGEADLVSGYGYPEEDRTPMVVVGVLVAVILIALVVWGLVL